MARAEQYSWASLLALVVIFGWFQMRMLDGWTILDQPASTLFAVYLGVIAAATVAEIAIAVALKLLSRGQTVERDERDLAIEARANQNERIFIIAAVNVLVWQLFFVLFALLFGGELVKRVSTIWLYRAQSARG